jgi:hypothetical protein
VEDNQGVKTLVLMLLLTPSVWAVSPEARSAKAKLDLIMDLKARRGSTIVFTARELSELAKVEVPRVVPDGFREPRVVMGSGNADGYALIDFKKLRHAQGAAPSWLDNLIEGERPVLVSIDLQSAKGWCTVTLKRLEISKIAATGKVLEVLVKSFFMTLFPNAKVNEPFELEFNIDRLEIRPAGLYVTIKK